MSKDAVTLEVLKTIRYGHIELLPGSVIHVSPEMARRIRRLYPAHVREAGVGVSPWDAPPEDRACRPWGRK